jgi:opacity protein-like surface antigen
MFHHVDHSSSRSHQDANIEPAAARISGARPSHTRAGLGAILALSLCVAAAATVYAQPTADASRYSHRGFKGAISCGTLHNNSKLNLEDGGMTLLGVGYGIDDNISVWMTLGGSEQMRDTDEAERTQKTTVGGMEFALQYRFLPGERVQPYGKIGCGGYSIEENDTHNAKAGGGLTVGAGADYFFSRHIGFGAEVTYRSVEFTQERSGRKGDFKDMKKSLDGDAVGIVFTFTII